MLRKTLWVLAFVLIPICVNAQTINNPSTVQFTASADQNTIQNGVAVLSSYEVRLYSQDGVTKINSLDIGKPTPDAANTITFSQLKNVYSSAPVGSYTIKVAAVGPGGANETPASDPFTVLPPAPSAPTGKPVIK